MVAYDAAANISFACPGHQGGQFYRKSPAGQLFYRHFGEAIFRNDLCNADVELGDLLIHVGAAVEAQKHAAQVFGAGPHLLRAQRHHDLQQDRHRRDAAP
jgi:arginine/lysine/ornithine decarboxylase